MADSFHPHKPEMSWSRDGEICEVHHDYTGDGLTGTHIFMLSACSLRLGIRMSIRIFAVKLRKRTTEIASCGN